MQENNLYEAIVIGGSYSGLSAGLALARAARKVLIIDNNTPCNRQTPHSHNFLTQDGSTPSAIAAIAKEQLLKYHTVSFLDGEVVSANRHVGGFEVKIKKGPMLLCQKLIMATGLRDKLPSIPGLKACWGISVIHCPYCHGYGFKDEVTGIIGNGTPVVGFVKMISNWSKNSLLFTNGPSILSVEEKELLARNQVQIVETEISEIQHEKGYVNRVVLKDGSSVIVKVIYLRAAVEQHSDIPFALGAELNEQGLLKVSDNRQTTVPNLFACGDNSAVRSVSAAVLTGSLAGVAVNAELIGESFV